MTDRELLEYIAAQVGTLTGKVDRIEKDVSGLKGDVNGLKLDVNVSEVPGTSLIRLHPLNN